MTEHPPGSLIAQHHGCLCPVRGNAIDRRKGAPPIIRQGCPLHDRKDKTR